MKKYEKKAALKNSWTNALIGILLIVLIGAGTRYGVWYRIMWMGDSEIFWDEFAELSMEMLMLSLPLPVISYLLAYGRYRFLAAHHPVDLCGVAKGVYGRPSVIFGVLLFMMEIVALAVIAFAVNACFALELNEAKDRIAFFTMLAIAAGGAVLNLILYSIVVRFLKPKWVQRS